LTKIGNEEISRTVHRIETYDIKLKVS